MIILGFVQNVVDTSNRSADLKVIKKSSSSSTGALRRPDSASIPNRPKSSTILPTKQTLNVASASRSNQRLSTDEEVVGPSAEDEEEEMFSTSVTIPSSYEPGQAMTVLVGPLGPSVAIRESTSPALVPNQSSSSDSLPPAHLSLTTSPDQEAAPCLRFKFIDSNRKTDSKATTSPDNHNSSSNTNKNNNALLQTPPRNPSGSHTCTSPCATFATPPHHPYEETSEGTSSTDSGADTAKTLSDSQPLEQSHVTSLLTASSSTSITSPSTSTSSVDTVAKTLDMDMPTPVAVAEAARAYTSTWKSQAHNTALRTDPSPSSLSSSSSISSSSASVSTTSSSSANRTGETFMYKVLVVGNAKCGKTSIIQRYARNAFDDNYTTTIGADYTRKVIPQDDGGVVQLQLWDLAGQDRFAKLTRPYFRHSRAAIVVFDIARAETFNAVREWKREIDEQFELDKPENRDAFPVILLMNKSDLLQSSTDELLRMGQKLEQLRSELKFTAAFTTSAKESKYVQEAMDCVIEHLYSREKKKKNGEDDDDEVDSLLESLGVGSNSSSSTSSSSSSVPGAGHMSGANVVDITAPGPSPQSYSACCYY